MMVSKFAFGIAKVQIKSNKKNYFWKIIICPIPFNYQGVYSLCMPVIKHIKTSLYCKT